MMIMCPNCGNAWQSQSNIRESFRLSGVGVAYAYCCSHCSDAAMEINKSRSAFDDRTTPQKTTPEISHTVSGSVNKNVYVENPDFLEI